MGNKYSGQIRQELLESRKISGYNINTIDFLREKFVLMCDDDLTMGLKTFAELLRVDENKAESIFKYFDIDGSKKIDSYEFICAVSLLSHSKLTDKAEAIFRLYDFDSSQVLNFDEMVVLFRCCLCSLTALSGRTDIPSIQEVETMVEKLLSRFDKDQDGYISLDEFKSIITKDKEILRLLKDYNLVHSHDLRNNYGGDADELPDCDSDLEEEELKVSQIDPILQEKRENSKIGIDVMIEKTNSKGERIERIDCDEATISKPWFNYVKKGQPASYIPDDNEGQAPDVKVTLEYIHGYRSYDSRNNIFYSPNGDLLYHAASVGIVLNRKNDTSSQKFFFGHTDDILSIATFEDLVATGQIGSHPIIQIWDSKHLLSKGIIRQSLKKGVTQLCFSNDGKKLAACCGDEYSTISIFDVSKIMESKGDCVTEGTLILTAKGPQTSIFHMTFDSTNIRLVLATKQGLSFGTSDRGTLDFNESGNWGSTQRQAILCIIAIEKNIIAGGYNGKILIWIGKNLDHSRDAHRGPIMAICKRHQDKGFLTGGNDGIIISWDGSYNKHQKYEIFKSRCSKDLTSFKIRSITESLNSRIIFGTRGGELVEIKEGDEFQIIIRSHFNKELKGLAIIPSSGEIVTVGQDRLLLITNINEKKVVECKKMLYKMNCVAVSADEKQIAIGCTNGYVLIVDSKSRQVFKTIKDRRSAITCIKYSPKSEDKEHLAVGGEDTVIIYYKVKDNYLQYKKFRAHNAPIIHIDFSETGDIVQSVCKNYEILYNNVSEGKLAVRRNEPIPQEIRDINWASWTSTVGWHSKGIWPPCSNGSDINAAVRSNDGRLIATVDECGLLKLFNFPCPSIHSSYVKFIAHSQHVTNVAFSKNSDCIITIGGKDKTIMQWKIEASLENSKKTPSPEMQHSGRDEDEEFFSYRTIPQGYKILSKENDLNSNKPYGNEIRESTPSNYKSPYDYLPAPNQNLAIKHVFGYRSEATKHAVKYSSLDKIVFITARLGVVMSIDKAKSRTQTFFTHHNEDVVSLAIHPKKHIAATGQMSRTDKNKIANIFVWDIETKDIISVLGGFHQGAAYLLKFSTDGSQLFSFGKDGDHSLAIYDWANSKLLSVSKVDRHFVTDIGFKNQNEFVTVGMRHIKFWSIGGNNLNFVRGKWNSYIPEPLLCAIFCFQQQVCFTGGISGKIYTWQGSTVSSVTEHYQDSPVRILFENKNNLYSGCDGGIIKMWNYNGKLQAQGSEIFNAKDQLKSLDRTIGCGIRSIDIKSDGGLLVATRGSTIFEVEVAEQSQSNIVMEGHSNGELWGLASFPKSSKFVTIGDDRTLRVWDANSLEQTVYAELPCGGRAVDWSSDGQKIAVALSDGKIILFNNSLKELSRIESAFKGHSQCIEEIKISPNDEKIVIGGSGNTFIELFAITTDRLTSIGQIQGMSSGVNHIDWSRESDMLMVNSRAYELRFCNTSSMKFGKSSSAKELFWKPWTCTLGWAVQGIYGGEDELLINSVSSAENDRLIAVGDMNSQIKLFSYPSYAMIADAKIYRGHAGPVSKVRFLLTDTYLISTGGQDRNIIVWSTDFATYQGIDEEDNTVFENEKDNENSKLEDLIVIGKKNPKLKIADDHLPLNHEGEEIGGPKTGGIFKDDNEDNRDQFLSIKPWQGTIVPPRTYLRPPVDNEKEPNVSLSLHHVFGYRAKDVRNNLKLVGESAIYFAANVIISQNISTRNQRFFTKHNDEVSCITLSENKSIIASGQIGDNPSIYIINAETLVDLIHIKVGIVHGLRSLAFSPNGKYLLATCVDADNTIVIYNTTNGAIVASNKGGKNTIVSCLWKSNIEFVTVGILHYKTWILNNGYLKDKKGIFSKAGKNYDRRLLCCALNRAKVLTGSSIGQLHEWEDNNITKSHSFHKKCIDMIVSLDD